jgi:hypothetical protein
MTQLAATTSQRIDHSCHDSGYKEQDVNLHGQNPLKITIRQTVALSGQGTALDMLAPSRANEAGVVRGLKRARAA